MCDVGTAPRQRCAIPRPRWGVLYALVVLVLVAFGVIEVAGPAGASGALLHGGLVVSVFAAMGGWMRANRAAFDLEHWCECAHQTVTVREIRPARTSNVEEETWAATTRS